MSGLVTFIVGSVAEAWAEFRTHKARVLMSLIAVAIAILALTGVTAIGQVAQQSVTESLERQSGRPALIGISAYPNDGTSPTDTSVTDAAFSAATKRYGIRWWSRVSYGSFTVATPQGSTFGSVQAVDADYGTMHRVRLSSGSWFRASDALRLAPAVVIDTESWKLLGSPDLATHPTLRITSPVPVTAVIIGITPGGYEQSFQAFMLPDAYRATQTTESLQQNGGGGQYEVWVPPAHATSLEKRLRSDLRRAAPDGVEVSAQRQDYEAQSGPDPLLLLKIVVGGAAGLLLLLAALGLVTISLVTVQGRVREIGIRRSFGATAGRVFLGVMMESIVATAVAGFVGVVLAVLALKNPWVTDFLTQRAGLQDVPAFPFTAALTGLLVAAGVGALAGLLPAIVAVRVKPIDAIRY